MHGNISKNTGKDKILDVFPLLKGLNERVSQLPKIKEYLESRDK